MTNDTLAGAHHASNDLSMMGVLVLVLWVLILLLTYACATSLDCAPGCQALQELSASSPGAVTLDGGSCYSVGSAYSTPALSVFSSTAEWAPSPPQGLPPATPVLDLCNQVQSIWLQPGAREKLHSSMWNAGSLHMFGPCRLRGWRVGGSRVWKP